MFRILVVSVLIVLACGAPQSKPKLDGRIVGGEDAEIEDYPYQLSLQYYGSHTCGASLIAPDIAITAAHCTDGSPASAFAVRAGTSIRGSGGHIIDVYRLHQNPDYNGNTIENDISVLILAGSFKLDDKIQTVDLPKSNEEPEAGLEAICSGWGTTTEGGWLPSKLQAVTVPIVNRKVCQDAYGPSSIKESMICAGYTAGGKDACQGDSGGPLVVDGKVSGIVSWGYGCARPNYPGVYSNVAHLRDFITEKAGI